MVENLERPTMEYRKCYQEFPALVFVIFLPRPYLYNDKHTVRTDHHDLRWIQNLADATKNLAIWRLHVTEYGSDIFSRASFKHYTAETLSLLPREGRDNYSTTDDIAITATATCAQKSVIKVTKITSKQI